MCGRMVLILLRLPPHHHPLQGVLPLLLQYAPSNPWVGLRSESTTPGSPWSASTWADGTTPLLYTHWAPSYPNASKGACVATSQVRVVGVQCRLCRGSHLDR